MNTKTETVGSLLKNIESRKARGEITDDTKICAGDDRAPVEIDFSYGREPQCLLIYVVR